MLKQIEKCSEQFTYSFYLECYPINKNRAKTNYQWQLSTFKNFSIDGNVISKQVIEKDIYTLNNIGKDVSALVDRGIAHLDKRGIKNNVTYNDLDECLNQFNKIACRYITLLTSEGYSSLEPVFQFDWEKIFTVPLDIRKPYEEEFSEKDNPAYEQKV